MPTHYTNESSEARPQALHRSGTNGPAKAQRPTTSTNQRTNTEWLLELRGQNGQADQQIAHQELSTYLYTIALNDLWMRKSSVHRLRQYGSPEIQTLAEDFVQEFCCKLTNKNHALLDKYRGEGRFLAWAAQVLRNMIRSEFRKRAWKVTERLDEKTLTGYNALPLQQRSRPDLIFHSNQLADLVEKTLSRLSTRHQVIFLRYVVDGERANIVAEDLGISAGGVYTAAHRIRETMGKTLIEAGYAL